MSQIRVEIGSLVLIGIPASEAGAIADSVRTELGSYLADSGLGSARLAAAGRRAGAELGTVGATSRASAASIGRAVAGAVVAAVQK